MPPSAPQLPAEVWHHVFMYLSTEEKLSVRASCKHFERLIDHPSLWKDWSVVLGFQNYNSRFWQTLRRRRVSSVVVRSSIKEKDWTHLGQSLPHTCSLVINLDSQFRLRSLYDFAHLRRLAVRSSGSPLTEETLKVRHPEQMTHLSLCHVSFTPTSMQGFIHVVSRLRNLTSLVWHQIPVIETTMSIIQSILTCLPKLKHLSLSILESQQLHFRKTSHNQEEEAHPGALDHPLSSLELVYSMYLRLPEDAMKLMPGLTSLSVFHKQGFWPNSDDHLKSWLRDLPHLSTLVLVNSPPVRMYVSSIPQSVTSLRLCGLGLYSGEIAAVAAQLPNLLHLHIDPWPSRMGASVPPIPQLFPKLQSLKVRQEHVPEKDLLDLLQLQDLKYLEILDKQPNISELISKLRAVAKGRVRVVTSPLQTDVLSCPWFCQVH